MKLLNLFLFLLGAKKRIAYVEDSWHAMLVNKALPYDQKLQEKKHQALKALQMAAPHLENVPLELYPKLVVPKNVIEGVRAFIPTDLPLLLLSASTTRFTSRFNELRYAAIVNELYKEYPHFFTLILSEKKDQLRATALKAELRVPHLLHFPASFKEFIGIIASSAVIFVGDGGISHLGAALEKRGVVLFGETNPMQWAPLGGDFELFYDPIHVNRLDDAKIMQALRNKVVEKFEMNGSN